MPSRCIASRTATAARVPASVVAERLPPRLDQLRLQPVGLAALAVLPQHGGEVGERGQRVGIGRAEFPVQRLDRADRAAPAPRRGRPARRSCRPDCSSRAACRARSRPTPRGRAPARPPASGAPRRDRPARRSSPPACRAPSACPRARRRARAGAPRSTCSSIARTSASRPRAHSISATSSIAAKVSGCSSPALAAQSPRPAPPPRPGSAVGPRSTRPPPLLSGASIAARSPDLATIAAACLRRLRDRIVHAAPRDPWSPERTGSARRRIPQQFRDKRQVRPRQSAQKIVDKHRRGAQDFLGDGDPRQSFRCKCLPAGTIPAGSEDFLRLFGAFRDESGDDICLCSGEYMAVTDDIWPLGRGSVLAGARRRRHLSRWRVVAAGRGADRQLRQSQKSTKRGIRGLPSRTPPSGYAAKQLRAKHLAAANTRPVQPATAAGRPQGGSAASVGGPAAGAALGDPDRRRHRRDPQRDPARHGGSIRPR